MEPYKFCLIDVPNLVHRCAHMVGPVESDEEFTQHVLQVIFQSIRKSYLKFRAHHVVCAFDSYSWRKQVYPEYKGNRNKPKSPEDENLHRLTIQALNQLKQFLSEQTNCTVLYGEAIEADDFIARWVQIHDFEQVANTIVSADSDFKQLVRGNVELFNPLSNTLYRDGRVYYQDEIRPKRGQPVEEIHGETWKVRMVPRKGRDSQGQEQHWEEPEQFDPEWSLFMKIIRGDSSDNIRSAFPRVREDRLRRAYQDQGGLEWNNLINDSFRLLEHSQPVRPLYERNRMLIDLREQPDQIKMHADEIIREQMLKRRKQMVQLYLIQFCNRHRLDGILKQSDGIAGMLSRPYDPT